jgi:hypothetical protein
MAEKGPFAPFNIPYTQVHYECKLFRHVYFQEMLIVVTECWKQEKNWQMQGKKEKGAAITHKVSSPNLIEIIERKEKKRKGKEREEKGGTKELEEGRRRLDRRWVTGEERATGGTRGRGHEGRGVACRSGGWKQRNHMRTSGRP